MIRNKINQFHKLRPNNTTRK